MAHVIGLSVPEEEKGPTHPQDLRAGGRMEVRQICGAQGAGGLRDTVAHGGEGPSLHQGSWSNRVNRDLDSTRGLPSPPSCLHGRLRGAA